MIAENTKNYSHLNYCGDLQVVKTPLKYQTLCHWLARHGHHVMTPSELPRMGAFVSVDGLETAAGFLRVCEGSYGMFDTVVTNPDAEPKARNRAMDFLTEALLTLARNSGMKVVTAYTYDSHTLARAKRYGFQAIPHTMIVKRLEELD